MTQDELAIIAYLERSYGRPLTPQEIYPSERWWHRLARW
jgi:hypothetical protein